MIFSQKGSATFFLVLLPLFLTLVCALIGAMALLLLYEKNQHQCRTNLLGAQTKIAKPLQSLLQLNSEAAAIRVEIATAKAALAAALASLNPPAIAAAKARLNAAQMHKQTMIWRQQAILMQAKFFSMQNFYSTRHAFKEAHSADRDALSKLMALTNYSMQVEPAPLAVTKADKLEPPLYKVVNDFSNKQKITARWSCNLDIGDGQPLHFWTPLSMKWSGSCAATLRQKGDTWEAILVAGS